MAFLSGRVLDRGLAALEAEANRLDICAGEPADYAAATGSASRGHKAGAAGSIIGVPAARSPDGRRVTVAAIADGSVTASGTATHWAITDTVNVRLLAAGDLQAAQAVRAGNLFSLPPFDIAIPGAP
jgi:hypothetical protein